MHILVPTEIKPKCFYYGMHNYSLGFYSYYLTECHVTPIYVDLRSLSLCIKKKLLIYLWDSLLGIRLENEKYIVIFYRVTKMPSGRENYRGY